MFDVNTMSYIQAATLALPALTESHGSILVVSSAAGKMGMPFVAPYAASKHALRKLNALQVPIRLFHLITTNVFRDILFDLAHVVYQTGSSTRFDMTWLQATRIFPSRCVSLAASTRFIFHYANTKMKYQSYDFRPTRGRAPRAFSTMFRGTHRRMRPFPFSRPVPSS